MRNDAIHTKTAAKAVKLICRSSNEVQVKITQVKIFKTLKDSQPQMEIYWLLQKTDAAVNDTVVQ